MRPANISSLAVVCRVSAGDVFDPAGTLEGGSPPSSGGAGGQPLLIKIGKILDVEEKVGVGESMVMVDGMYAMPVILPGDRDNRRSVDRTVTRGRLSHPLSFVRRWSPPGPSCPR